MIWSMTSELLSPPTPSHASSLLEAPMGLATNTKPLVAVVFTHNDEATLERCLASIHSCVQDIWVLDAGSTDDTLTIARRYTEHVYHLPEGDSWHMWQVAQAALSAEYPQDAWLLWLEPGDWLPVESQQQLERWHRLESVAATGGLLLKQMLHHWNGQPLYWGGLVQHDCRLAQLSTICPDDHPMFCGWALEHTHSLGGVVIHHQPYRSFGPLLQGALHWGHRHTIHRHYLGLGLKKCKGMLGTLATIGWQWVRYLGWLDGKAGMPWILLNEFGLYASTETRW